MNPIFVSYAGVDRGRVTTLVDALEALGLRVWWDRDITSGQNYHRAIEEALRSAPCVIVAWTAGSVASDWVVNEASEARKRGRLVPVLLDPVDPPLEFRHLQAVNLSDWAGDPADPGIAQLQRDVTAMLGSSAESVPVRNELAIRRRSRSWPVRARITAGLLVALSLLLFTLWQRDRAADHGAPGGAAAVPRSPVAANPAGVADEPASVVTRPSPEPTNLLDVGAGAALVDVNLMGEAYWPTLFTDIPSTAPVVVNGYAVLALAGELPVTFDTLAVHVSRTWGNMGVKDLALSTSTTAAGPFVTVAQVSVPAYQDRSNPFHEFSFATVEARFVKLQVLSFHPGATFDVGYIGSIRLYDRNRTTSTR